MNETVQTITWLSPNVSNKFVSDLYKPSLNGYFYIHFGIYEFTLNTV